jgi:hypothetical protein
MHICHVDKKRIVGVTKLELARRPGHNLAMKMSG